jgi:hypothetical protein
MAKINRNRVTDADTSNMDMPHDVEAAAYSDASDADQPHKRASRPAAIGDGWGAPQEERREVVKAPYIDFKKGSSKKLVKVLEAKPTAQWKQHYVASVRPPFLYCLQDDGCPLCDEGHKSAWNFLLSVVEMNDNAAEVRRWTFSWPVMETLRDSGIPLIEGGKTIAVNDPNRYFVLTHIPGTGIQVVPVKGTDLEEDFGISPLTADELEELSQTSYGAETIFTKTASQLAVVARDLKDTDFPKGHDRNP